MPMSEGWSRIRSRMIGSMAKAAMPRISVASRQPNWTTIQVMTGRKMSCPAEVPAPKTPCTSPRFSTNQRAARDAPSTPLMPVAAPTRIPQSTVMCQSAVIAEARTTLTPPRTTMPSMIRRML